MTIHDLCTVARNTDCACGAAPGQDCKCERGHYHLSRFARTVQAGRMTYPDLASVIPGDELFTGMTTIPDPGGAA